MTVPTPTSTMEEATAAAPDTALSPEAEQQAFIQAQRDAQKIIERAPTNDVPLAELNGLSISEQFYRVWGTPERGQALWDSWYRSLGPAAESILTQYASSTAEELSIPLDEARWRLAVDKVLNDCGAQFAVRFMNRYNAEALQKTRTLQPMAPRRRKK